jgi:hypothetical protein
MTPAGLRSLFRHHRQASHVPQANPHRFRHTFGTDMARAGISVPALMHLMGHAHIRTTMLYVQLSPQDVWAGIRLRGSEASTELSNAGGVMARRRSLEQIFDAHIDILATTLRPGSLHGYRWAVKSFLCYLRANYPRLYRISALRRDPHILGWLTLSV